MLETGPPAVGERVVECTGRTETTRFESVLRHAGNRHTNIFDADSIVLQHCEIPQLHDPVFK